MAYTEGIMAPEIFRLWTAITTVAGSLERRVWIETSAGLVYPNIFTLLVAPPGVGKSAAISRGAEFWRKTKKLHVSPDSLTKASLMDTLGKSARQIVLEGGRGLYDYHSLQIAAPELGVFLSAYDLEFLSALNHIYDNPPSYREERRTGGRSLDIQKPQCTILAGTQPGFMASIMPEEAWSMGTTSRMVMVYAGQAPEVDLFDAVGPESRPDIERELAKAMANFVGLFGKFMWDKPASNELIRWHKSKCEPVPLHSRLQHYNPRRMLHVLKLCQISAASRGEGLVIRLSDVERAIGWLLHAETLMPDVFRHMAGKSDGQVIQEMHFFLWRLWAQEKKPIHESRIINFLSNRVPSDKILRIIEMAEKMEIITKFAPGLYTPKATNEHKME